MANLPLVQLTYELQMYQTFLQYVLNLLPKGTHNYEKFIRPSEIDGWARNFNLSISSIIGMTYNPLTKKYKLGDDVSVNYMTHYKKG